MLAGHSFAHFPHPTHNSLSMTAWMPWGMVIAFLGQTFIQHPQATHSRILTDAFLFAMVTTPFLVASEESCKFSFHLVHIPLSLQADN